jgi:hypothetical protein
MQGALVEIRVLGGLPIMAHIEDDDIALYWRGKRCPTTKRIRGLRPISIPVLNRLGPKDWKTIRYEVHRHQTGQLTEAAPPPVDTVVNPG